VHGVSGFRSAIWPRSGSWKAIGLSFAAASWPRASLVATAPTRIVNTASAAHRGNVLDFDDLQMEKHYRAMTAYGRSKLANILFTRELARRLAGTGVTANCLHPGFVATRFGQSEGGIFAAMVRLLMVFASRPERGANTIVHLTASPDVATRLPPRAQATSDLGAWVRMSLP
jgi:NAD(P)-dependent dehydrogenase (short-subunit alcohol dehydrogenase family)